MASTEIEVLAPDVFVWDYPQNTEDGEVAA
jgi:hypothetical protein